MEYFTNFERGITMQTRQLLSEIQRLILRHAGDAAFLRRAYDVLTLLEETLTQQGRSKRNRR